MDNGKSGKTLIAFNHAEWPHSYTHSEEVTVKSSGVDLESNCNIRILADDTIVFNGHYRELTSRVTLLRIFLISLWI